MDTGFCNWSWTVRRTDETGRLAPARGNPDPRGVPSANRFVAGEVEESESHNVRGERGRQRDERAADIRHLDASAERAINSISAFSFASRMTVAGGRIEARAQHPARLGERIRVLRSSTRASLCMSSVRAGR
jgi:hypothetical protein